MDFIKLNVPSKISLNFILFFGIVFGQYRDDIQKTDDDKIKMVRNYYDNEILKEEGKKSGSLKIGPWTYWRKDGKKYLMENYVDGKKNGSQITWHDNGEISTRHEYKNGLRNGKFVAWYENGNKKQTGTFIDDLKDGMMSYWYDNGQIWMQENYDMGKKHGLLIGWYKNGKKIIQQNWKNDRKNGPHLMWYSNGVKKEEGVLIDGKEVGRWIYYTDNGNVDKELDHD
tara:strand:- start:158 stop:838 length:681 start_codon:yes stop_codon:yes gene_type:complete